MNITFDFVLRSVCYMPFRYNVVYPVLMLVYDTCQATLKVVKCEVRNGPLCPSGRTVQYFIQCSMYVNWPMLLDEF